MCIILGASRQQLPRTGEVHGIVCFTSLCSGYRDELSLNAQPLTELASSEARAPKNYDLYVVLTLASRVLETKATRQN